jgi:hypothetical protein
MAGAACVHLAAMRRVSNYDAENAAILILRQAPEASKLRNNQLANLRAARTAFRPPNANEWESATLTGMRRASFGT